MTDIPPTYPEGRQRPTRTPLPAQIRKISTNLVAVLAALLSAADSEKGRVPMPDISRMAHAGDAQLQEMQRVLSAIMDNGPGNQLTHQPHSERGIRSDHLLPYDYRVDLPQLASLAERGAKVYVTKWSSPNPEGGDDLREYEVKIVSRPGVHTQDIILALQEAQNSDQRCSIRALYLSGEEIAPTTVKTEEFPVAASAPVVIGNLYLGRPPIDAYDEINYIINMQREREWEWGPVLNACNVQPDRIVFASPNAISQDTVSYIQRFSPAGQPEIWIDEGEEDPAQFREIFDRHFYFEPVRATHYVDDGGNNIIPSSLSPSDMERPPTVDESKKVAKQ